MIIPLLAGSGAAGADHLDDGCIKVRSFTSLETIADIFAEEISRRGVCVHYQDMSTARAFSKFRAGSLDADFARFEDFGTEMAGKAVRIGAPWRYIRNIMICRSGVDCQLGNLDKMRIGHLRDHVWSRKYTGEAASVIEVTSVSLLSNLLNRDRVDAIMISRPYLSFRELELAVPYTYSDVERVGVFVWVRAGNTDLIPVLEAAMPDIIRRTGEIFREAETNTG